MRSKIWPPVDKIIKLDVVSDMVCPWCYLGQRRLAHALDLYGRARVEVKWRPYQLAPDMPPEGMDRKAYYKTKFGDDPKIKEMSKQLVVLGKAAGITFNFDAIERSPNTLKAHRLSQWASTAGVQNAVVACLFKAYFEDARDIGQDDVLIAIAEDNGMDGDLVKDLLSKGADKELVQRDIEKARAMGVSGVPTFIANNRFALTGAQEPETLVQFFTQVEQQDWLPETNG